MIDEIETEIFNREEKEIDQQDHRGDRYGQAQKPGCGGVCEIRVSLSRI